MKKVQIIALCVVFAVVMLMGSALWAEETAKTNINSATVEELAQLKRIGPKYAARIVEYREKNGPFKNPEDITLVKGIGTKTFEVNKDNICVE